MKKTTIIGFALMVIISFAIQATAYEKPDFPDVPKEHWAYDNVMKVADLGIINGYDTGFYGPDESATVGEFLTMVGRALYLQDCEEKETSVWWETYYLNALEKGLIMAEEYERSSNDMGTAISRNEMAMIMVRADENINGNDSVVAVLKAIPDWSDIPEVYQPYAAQAFCKGLLLGKESGFSGNDTLSRAEAATVIIRLLKPKTLPEPPADDLWRKDAPEFIEEILNELESKGWSNFEVIEGEVDTTRWGGIVLDSNYEDDFSQLYTVIGQTDGLFDNPISVVVKASFTKEYLEWKRQDLFYISSSGRFWGGEYLPYDEILTASNQELYDYMYSH